MPDRRLDSSRFNDQTQTMERARGKRGATARPPTLEELAFVTLLKACDALQQDLAPVLKAEGLSGTQYNALRILRGAGPEGLVCREIGARMLTHDPDVTRLLDRLESRGLVVRSRERRDRRAVTTRITATGLAALEKLDEPVRAAHRRQFERLGKSRLEALVALLESVRHQAGEGS
jgi:MarR family transcriptional regulator, organic hydroperoxide resistance regulator